MAYLSLVPAHMISPEDTYTDRRGLLLFDEPQFRHRAVMGLFGTMDGKPRADAGILFRVDTQPGRAPAFLIQSLVVPSHLPDQAKLKEFSFAELQEGTVVSFRIAVNGITRSTVQVEGKTREVVKPVSIDDPAQESQPFTRWLGAKLAPALDQVEVINHQREVLGADRVGRKRAHFVVQIDSVDGVAIVRDPADLRRKMEHGVGRAKSYGCGLLSVRTVGVA